MIFIWGVISQEIPQTPITKICLRITHLKFSSNPRRPGPRFNIKMTTYQYRKSHCGDKTILRPSYLHNGISYTGKTTSLYWIRAQWVKAYLPVLRGIVMGATPTKRVVHNWCLYDCSTSLISLAWRHITDKASYSIEYSTNCSKTHSYEHKTNQSSALLAFCDGNPSVTSEFPTQCSALLVLGDSYPSVTSEFPTKGQ